MWNKVCGKYLRMQKLTITMLLVAHKLNESQKGLRGDLDINESPNYLSWQSSDDYNKGTHKNSEEEMRFVCNEQSVPKKNVVTSDSQSSSFCPSNSSLPLFSPLPLSAPEKTDRVYRKLYDSLLSVYLSMNMSLGLLHSLINPWLYFSIFFTADFLGRGNLLVLSHQPIFPHFHFNCFYHFEMLSS